MSKLELTPWYPGNVKPVRVGVYQQLCGFGSKLGYQYWDGRAWRGWCASPKEAVKYPMFASVDSQNDQWRGVLK